MLVLFVATFFLFVGVSFYFLNGENSGSKVANEKIDLMAKRLEDLDIEFRKARGELMFYQNSNFEQTKITADKLKQKLEALEMKVDADKRAPQKPIQVSLVYRKFQSPVKTVTLAPDPNLLRAVKKKLESLSN